MDIDFQMAQPEQAKLSRPVVILQHVARFDADVASAAHASSKLCSVSEAE
jgi:hypothetical protein